MQIAFRREIGAFRAVLFGWRCTIRQSICNLHSAICNLTEELPMLSRRSFLWLTSAAAGLSVSPLSAQRGRGGSDATGPVPASIAALTSMRDRAKPITADERRARIEKAQAADGRTEDRRDHAGRRHLAHLLHRHPLGQQRAAVRRRHPEGRAIRSSSRRRSRKIARASSSRRAAGAHRRRGLAGGREPVRARRAGAEGSRHRHGPHRHRGDVEVRVRRQHRRRGAGAEGRRAPRRSPPAAG